MSQTKFTSTSKSQNEQSYFDDCDLSDDLLSEGSELEWWVRESKLQPNMDRFASKPKIMDVNHKKAQSIPSKELNFKLDLAIPLSTTPTDTKIANMNICKSVRMVEHISSIRSPRKIKEQISSLLRSIVNEKRTNIKSETPKRVSSSNCCEYVTMKDINCPFLAEC